MLPIFENQIVDIYRELCDGNLSQAQIVGARERLYTIHHLLRASDDSWPIKTCSCGRQHTAVGWLNLPLVGYQIHNIMGGEMRNCQCGSTMFIAARRKPFGQTKAMVLQNTIISGLRPGADAKPPFTLDQCFNITNAYRMSEYDMYYDEWSDKQVLEAAYGRTPEWEVSESGNLIPV